MPNSSVIRIKRSLVLDETRAYVGEDVNQRRRSVTQQSLVKPQVIQESHDIEEESQGLNVIQEDWQRTPFTPLSPFSPNVTQISTFAPFYPNNTLQTQMELSEPSLTFEDLWDLYGPSDNSADPWDCNET